MNDRHYLRQLGYNLLFLFHTPVSDVFTAEIDTLCIPHDWNNPR